MGAFSQETAFSSTKILAPIQPSKEKKFIRISYQIVKIVICGENQMQRLFDLSASQVGYSIIFPGE